ncbi:hypothetical protein QCA50_015198 [Cerrena zonata]|uniref:Uncharacterized protein n=1 Tax=Cerrena zonata TaxID=2478898 RepID=A0AAW0FM34_9APHY
MFATDQYDSRRFGPALFLTPFIPSAALVQEYEALYQAQLERATHPTPPRRPHPRESATVPVSKHRRRHQRTPSTGTVAYMTSTGQNPTFPPSSSSFIPPHFLDEPGSPPPYSPTPPDPPPAQQAECSNPQFLSRRSASSPHINSPPSSPTFGPYSAESSRRPSTIALHTRRSRQFYARVETSDDPDTDASLSEDTVIYTSTRLSLAGTLRARLLGKGKGRADDAMRPISTAPGVIGAGETETEGEDTPRNLPTARTSMSSHPSLPHRDRTRDRSNLSITPILTTLTTLTHEIPSSARSLIPILFELSRLLSVVPAVVGTLWNLYHVWRPPTGLGSPGWTRSEFMLSVFWSVLTGWQCLQLTTGLLKRWRVYYGALPTLIRLLGLQAICWPATHFTLTLFDHSKRPLICWAIIGTTTSCSRSIQMWVTSNIIVFPQPHHHFPHSSSHSPSSSPLRESTGDGGSGALVKEKMKMTRKRKWDWGAVIWRCALPAGLIYFVMAWVEVLRREFERGSQS